jgi:hypothetical protein
MAARAGEAAKISVRNARKRHGPTRHFIFQLVLKNRFEVFIGLIPSCRLLRPLGPADGFG